MTRVRFFAAKTFLRKLGRSLNGFLVSSGMRKPGSAPIFPPQVAANLQRSERLRQALLKNAFSGVLVSSDISHSKPNDLLGNTTQMESIR